MIKATIPAMASVVIDRAIQVEIYLYLAILLVVM
jgi:hypothetical protein